MIKYLPSIFEAIKLLKLTNKKLLTLLIDTVYAKYELRMYGKIV